MHGEICSICCGTEREVTVSCPLDCQYLQEARQRERPPGIQEDQLPNRDIRLTEDFLRKHEELLLFLSVKLLHSTLETPGAVDLDDREALEALIRTYRTLESGLYYESRPANPIAGSIFQRMQEAIGEYRKEKQQQEGIHTIRDAEVLGLLAFLQRMELTQNNGRPRGRAFLDFLRSHFPQQAPPAAAAPLIY